MAFVERAAAHAASRTGTSAGAAPPRPPPRDAASTDDDDEPPPRPRAVGILRLEVYVPRRYVDQADLEAYDGAPPGKYTAGLGQQSLAFCGDGEDAVSLALTALDGLLTKARVAPAAVGALYVGTESAPDRAKSVKSCLMRLLAEKSGGASPASPPCAHVEGADLVSACYAGTAALMTAVNWVQSESWDGRYAVVVATDIAVYAAGPARPAGGCGAVALLVGPDAPLPLERGVQSAWCADVWDFYKPAGLWPVVAGRLSVDTYLAGLDATYASVMAKLDAKKQAKTHAKAAATTPPPSSLAADVDYVVLHAPYGKLLRKAFARLAPADAARAAAAAARAPPPPPGPGPDYDERAAVAASADDFERVVGPSAWLARNAGNMYAASLFGGLAALVETVGAALAGRRILLYSYGSGASAHLYSIVPRRGRGEFTLAAAAACVGLRDALAARRRAPPAALAAALAAAEARHCAADYVPDDGRAAVRRGAWRLVRVDAAHRRAYARRSDDDESDEEEGQADDAAVRAPAQQGDVEDAVAAG